MSLTIKFASARRFVLTFGILVGALAFPDTASAGPLCPDLELVPNTAGSICRNFEAGTDVTRFYWFDTADPESEPDNDLYDHLLRITIRQVVDPFGLRFNRLFRPAGDDFGVDGYECVAYGPGGTCIEYRTPTALEPNGTPDPSWYNGPIIWTVAWSQPIGTSPTPEIVHAEGDSLDFELLPGIYFSAEHGPADVATDYCFFPGVEGCPTTSREVGIEEFYAFKDSNSDPVRAALSDNFSGAGVVQAVVPEPGTMALMGLGAGAYLASLRRRRARR